MIKSTGRDILFFLAWVVLTGLCIGGCAPNVAYYPQVNQYLQQGNYAAARELILENEDLFAAKNKLIYYLDEGVVNHYAGLYAESNRSFETADTLIDFLYTRSISRAMATFLINDNTTEYGGEDFESALVNLFMALNYSAMGKWEDALVEARRVDVKLSEINARYVDGEKNVYKEDAFIRFLMGVLYEAEGEINDAFISFRKAEEIYRSDYTRNYGVTAPRFLVEKLIDSARAMGFDDIVSQLEDRYQWAAVAAPEAGKDTAEIYTIHYNGVGAEKREAYLLVPMPDRYIMKIAYPRFEKAPARIREARVQLNASCCEKRYEAATVLMEDISGIAVLNLENRIGRIKTKAVARATAKYIAAKAAEKAAREEHGDNMGVLVQLAFQTANILSEQADIRHWRLLPAQIRVARTVVPAGAYEGRVFFVDSGGAAVRSETLPSFSVRAGEKKFFIFRTIE